MILVNKLKGEIVSKGLTQGEVARMIGLTPKTFSCRLKRGILGSNEIEQLMDILEIDDPRDIFFVREVAHQETKSA